MFQWTVDELHMGLGTVPGLWPVHGSQSPMGGLPVVKLSVTGSTFLFGILPPHCLYLGAQMLLPLQLLLSAFYAADCNWCCHLEMLNSTCCPVSPVPGHAL